MLHASDTFIETHSLIYVELSKYRIDIYTTEALRLQVFVFHR